MASEMLRQIGEAEERADLIRRQANEAARSKVEQATVSAKAILAECDAKIKAETERLIKEAGAKADQAAQQYLADIAGQGETIKAEAQQKLAKAVDIIVAKVVSVSG